MDGHSGRELPVPISNTEVKTADVPAGTALCVGKLVRCPPFFIFSIKFINHSPLSFPYEYRRQAEAG